jgi:hypothetical protein
MDEMKENRIPGENDQGYTPRPLWQVWMARVGLVLMILFVIYQLLSIAMGGL